MRKTRPHMRIAIVRSNSDMSFIIPYSDITCMRAILYHRLHRWCNGVLVSSVVDSGLEHPSTQAKDYEISICCFSAKYVALMNNVFKWGNISTCG